MYPTIDKSLIPTAFICLFLTGCATYKAVPLPQKSEPLKFKMLIEKATNSPLIAADAIIITNGLSIDEIATLALFNSPELQIYREQYNVKNASAYNISLLPDPQFGASVNRPTNSPVPAVNAWSMGIGYDFNALLTYKAMNAKSTSLQKQSELELLWQVSQIVSQAKLLSIDLYYTQQKIILTSAMVEVWEQRYQQSKKGIEEGNVTLETNGTDLSVLLDMYSQLDSLKQEENDTSHQLMMLLGIDNLVGLTLTTISLPDEIKSDNIEQALSLLQDNRPDLLALQAGYLAQESEVRAAVLAQFPSFNLGISSDRDTAGLRTNGINLGITLPLFNGNKGNILIARATRKQLAEEFNLRIIQTRNDVSKLVEFDSIISQQQKVLLGHLPQLTDLVKRGQKAYVNGDIDVLTFINMESTLFSKRFELLNLAQNKWRTYINLLLLLMHN